MCPFLRPPRHLPRPLLPDVCLRPATAGGPGLPPIDRSGQARETGEGLTGMRPSLTVTRRHRRSAGLSSRPRSHCNPSLDKVLVRKRPIGHRLCCLVSRPGSRRGTRRAGQIVRKGETQSRRPNGQRSQRRLGYLPGGGASRPHAGQPSGPGGSSNVWPPPTPSRRFRAE
jgi:hypothetical protein